MWAHQAPSAARALTRARLGVSRRDFLLQGYQCGVDGLSTVELLVRHPLQLLGREMHVLVDVPVLLRCIDTTLRMQEASIKTWQEWEPHSHRLIN